MRTVRFVGFIFSAGMMVLTAGGVHAQDFPNKPIRMIINGEAGGGGDIVARLIAPGLTSTLGQSVIVDNRPTGVTGGQAVSQAPPDGYTLLVTGNGVWLGPLLGDNAPYDAVKDFAPITLTSRQPNVLVVHPSLPVKSVKELIALAKARPGELNYASTSIGSATHLAGELFKAMAGINIVRIPYKGAPGALNDLIAGRVHLMFALAATALPHVKSGKLSALAVTTAEPSALAPGLPTVAASGVPSYESVSVLAIFAPAKTPAATVKRLNQEIVQALNRADLKQKLFDSGVEVVGNSPEELAAKIRSDIATWGRVIKDAGIRAE